MEKTLKILILEDNREDAELTLASLKRSDLKFIHKWVDNEADYSYELGNFVPDVVLSDHSLPSFTSVEALSILKQNCISSVFILITGTVSEEFAVDILKAGADDYVLKTSLKRLPSAVINAYTKKQAERERESNFLKLQDANKELKTFIYRASHDIRGPICSLKGLINAAKDEDMSTDLAKLIRFMDKSADKLDVILMNLLETIELRDCPVETEKIDFEVMIAEILMDYKDLAVFQTIKFSVVAHKNPVFYTDKNILFRILKSIIDNSIKYHNYSMEYPYITIEAKEVPYGIQILVSDNGIGIKRELTERVFEMFFRASSLNEGTGLGLYLAKIGAERLGGSIGINSEENVGTIISVFLPHGLENTVITHEGNLLVYQNK